MSTATQTYLDSFINHELHLGNVPSTAFKLDRMRALLRELGDPQARLKTVHVAGTKGKGSVCAVMASILRAAGYTVGLYTSPHLSDFRERIRVLTMDNPGHVPGVVHGDIFPDCLGAEELDGLVAAARPAIERVRALGRLGRLTYFEVTTALAWLCFERRGVDVVVLETGMGGRLDATNVCDSLVAVITPVSLEHTKILGGTVEAIAAEKAGIIKAGTRRVVAAPQAEGARAVIEARCRGAGLVPLFADAAGGVRITKLLQTFDGQLFDLSTATRSYGRVNLPLIGRHQRENAAVAICAVEALGEIREAGLNVPPAAVIEGCADACWPARLETVARAPRVLLDGAHNAASAAALVETLREVLGRDGKVVLVFGASNDKDIAALRATLAPIARKVILAHADHPRAAALDGAVDVATALDYARIEAGHDGIILVAGSLFLAAEARRILGRV